MANFIFYFLHISSGLLGIIFAMIAMNTGYDIYCTIKDRMCLQSTIWCELGGTNSKHFNSIIHALILLIDNFSLRASQGCPQIRR